MLDEKVLSFILFFWGSNVTLYVFQKSPHISEQKGDPGGLDDPPLRGDVWEGVFWGAGGGMFFTTLTCSWLGLAWALFLPDTTMKAKIERSWCTGPADRVLSAFSHDY